MTKEELLDFNCKYIGALTLAAAVKKLFTELEAPCLKALIKVIDGEVERLYDEQYEQERIIFETDKILNAKN